MRKLQEGLTGTMAEPDTLKGYYALGIANQELGQLEAAIAAFEVILGRDLDYQDTLDRCRQLRDQVEAAKQPVAQEQTPAAAMNETPLLKPGENATTPDEDRADDDDEEEPLLDDARLANPDQNH